MWVVMRFLHLVCWAHLVLHFSGVPGANAQDEEEDVIGEIYDFATPMQLPGVEAIESVIESDFYIRGPIEIRQLPILTEAVRMAVARVCQLEDGKPAPVLGEKPVLDIATMLEVNKGFQMKFYIMPPYAGGRLCMDSLLMAGFGGNEPPFNEESNPEPPIRSLLYWEFIASGELAGLAEDLDLWYIVFQNFTCDYEDALAPPMENRSLNPLGATTTLPPMGVSTTKWPDACMDGLDVPFWDPSHAAKIKDASTSCSLAGSACMCGAIPGCYWGYQSAGGYRCQEGPAGVSCRACPKQLKCPVDSPEVCPTMYTACNCANAVAPCVWDKARAKCRAKVRDWEYTPCDACSRQGSCPGPDITSIDPDHLEVMGAPEVGWLINVTWNRRVKFGVGDLKAELACRAAGTTGGEVTFRFTQERMKLMYLSNSTVLMMNVQGLQNDRMRDCDVVLGEALVMDEWFKPNDLIAGMRTLTIEDLVNPEILTFDPPNSPNPVNVTPTAVTLVFTENVRAAKDHATPKLELWQLGGSWAGGGSGADVVVEEYPTVQDPEVPGAVTFEGNKMTVELGLVIIPDRMYSITLAEGVIMDYAGNPLPKLELGGYAFRISAGVDDTVAAKDEPPLIPPDVLRYGAMGISGAVILCALGWGFGRVQCRRPRVPLWDGKDTSTTAALEVTSRLGQEIDNLDLFKGASAVSTLAESQMLSLPHMEHSAADLVDPESGSTPMSALRVKITNAWVEQSLRVSGHTTGSPRHAFHNTWGTGMGSERGSPRFSGDGTADERMRHTAMGRLQISDLDSDFSPISRKDRRIPSDMSFQSFVSYVDARSPASTAYTQPFGARRRSWAGEPGTADCSALVPSGSSMGRSPSPKLPGSVRDPSTSSRRTSSSPVHWNGRTSSRKSSSLSQATQQTVTMSIREFGEEIDQEGSPAHGRWHGRTSSRKSSGLSAATQQTIQEFGEVDEEGQPAPGRWRGRTSSRKSSGLSQVTQDSIDEFGEDSIEAFGEEGDLESSPDHSPAHGRWHGRTSSRKSSGLSAAFGQSVRDAAMGESPRPPQVVAAPPPLEGRASVLALTSDSWARNTSITSHSLVSRASPPRSPTASPKNSSRKSRASPRPRVQMTPRHGGMLW